jgi:hypothetical protein
MTTLEVEKISAAEYHADYTFISRSMLEVFRDSPRRYHARFITGTMPAPEPTDDMQFGTWFHTYSLEPDRYLAEEIIAPQFGPDGKRWDRRTKLHKEAWTELEAKANGGIIIPHETHMQLFDMRRAVARCEKAQELVIDPGPVEATFRWTDDETGLPCKMRLDKLARGGTVIADIKTCTDSNPEPFSRSAVNFGYHRQAAFYLDGFALATGEDAAGMVFIACSKEPPYDVACYELDQDAIALGREQNRATLRKLAAAMESGDWRGAHEGVINRIALPKFAFLQDQWEV